MNRFPEQSDNYYLASHDGTIESFYAVSDKNTYRLPDYHRLDLSGSFRFNMFGSTGKPNAISISLFNAYNRRNVSSKQFQIVEGKTSSTSTIRELDEDEEAPAKSFKLNYTQGESTTLSSSDFNYYGTYTISLIHICYEYAVMSQGGSTSSAALVDVKGNVDGGYGIFTGISSVDTNIRVVEGSSPF